MSYEKFKPVVWADEYLMGIDRKSVFAKNTYRKYEGKVKSAGDVVTIPSIVKPTVTLTTDGKVGKLGDPEIVADTAAKMVMNIVTKFDFQVEDIDEAQTQNGLIADLTSEASSDSASQIDAEIGKIALDQLAPKLNSSVTAVTVDNVLGMIDAAVQKLYEKDVPTNETLYMTVTPRFYMILKQKYQALDTNNSQLLKDGYLAKYGSVNIDMSNNVATASSGANDFIMLRTGRAIAYANPIAKVVPYKPDRFISEGVKGFSLAGTKLIRPNELVVLNVKYA